MKRLLLILMLLACLKASPQCSTSVVPSGVFQSDTLLSLDSFVTYHLHQSLSIDTTYTMNFVIHSSNPGTCLANGNPPACELELLIYFGWSPLDSSGKVISINSENEINTSYGTPFPTTPTSYNVTFQASGAYSYISLVYTYNTGMTWIGCPTPLIIDSFAFTSTNNTLLVDTQVTNACAGDSNGIAIVHASGTPPFTYNWSTGLDGVGDSILSHIPRHIYYVTVTDANGCSLIESFYVGDRSSPDAFIADTGDVLTANPATSYQWYLNDTAIAGATSQIYVAVANGNYTVENVDSTGCTSVMSGPIFIDDISDINYIKDLSAIRILPNPTTDKLFISTNGAPATLRLLDLTGRELLSHTCSENENQIDVGQLAKGLYLASIERGEAKVCLKLIIQ